MVNGASDVWYFVVAGPILPVAWFANYDIGWLHVLLCFNVTGKKQLGYA